MTALDPAQTEALYRAAHERRLGEVVAGMLAERVPFSARLMARQARDEIEKLERELAEARGRLAAVEALGREDFIPGPAIACRNPRDRDDQWRKAVRTALTPDADA